MSNPRTGAVELIHALLGCDWGTKVALPDDGEVCIRQARRRMVLHGHASGTLELKVCHKHAAVLERETDPHGSGRGGVAAGGDPA